MQRIVVLGAGFAGLWSAIGAVRALDERGIGADRVEVTVVNATPWHSVRVRNYEADLSGVRVPLAGVLDPIGVRLVVADIVDLSVSDRTITCIAAGGPTQQLAYDRMVFCLGSRLVRPPIPGLREHAFDVDTYEAAMHVETRAGVEVAAIDAGGATLTGGERIDARTVVWCAGMAASPLTANFPVARDRSGRLAVKPSLKIEGLSAEFAAGDAAWFAIDGAHCCVMSCQHG